MTRVTPRRTHRPAPDRTLACAADGAIRPCPVERGGWGSPEGEEGAESKDGTAAALERESIGVCLGVHPCTEALAQAGDLLTVVPR